MKLFVNQSDVPTVKEFVEAITSARSSSDYPTEFRRYLNDVLIGIAKLHGMTDNDLNAIEKAALNETPSKSYALVWNRIVNKLVNKIDELIAANPDAITPDTMDALVVSVLYDSGIAMRKPERVMGRCHDVETLKEDRELLVDQRHFLDKLPALKNKLHPGNDSRRNWAPATCREVWNLAAKHETTVPMEEVGPDSEEELELEQTTVFKM